MYLGRDGRGDAQGRHVLNGIWLRRFFRRGYALALTMGAGAVLLACWFQFSSLSAIEQIRQRLDFLVFDFRFSVMPLQRPEVGHEIVIIDIDEKSLREQGRWPWSRARVAELITQLADLGAVVVAFDIVFAEPERNLAEELAGHLAEQGAINPVQSQWLDTVADQVDFDRRLAESLGATDVVLAYFLQVDRDTRVGKLPPPVYALSPEQAQRLGMPPMRGYTTSLPSLQSGAITAGAVSIDPDLDGVIRRAPLLLRYGDGLYPSLSLAAAQAYLFADSVDIQLESHGDTDAIASIRLTQETTYTDAQGRVIVPYRGPRGSFPYISATDVLEGRLAAESLDSVIALVGTSAVGLADLRSTPLQRNFPGVEIHANVLDGILSKDIPARPDWWQGATLILLIGTGLFLAVLFPFLTPVWMTLVAFATLAGVVGVNFYLWQQQLLDLPLASSLMLVMVLSTVNLVIGFLRENVHRRMLKSMFDQYVPPAHIDSMMDSSGSESSFLGESRHMSVLFSDIRSFTTISENLSAVKLKELLNLYFTPITETIFNHQGTIDKYVGDMVMAFWGAPLEDHRHAEHAIAAALEMLAITERLKSDLAARGLPEIRVGIGINSGDMNVGDMGSTFRRAYTVLGDAVNLGSRLEGLTKYYGVQLLVGDDTRREAENCYAFRLVDRIQVKGKEEAVLAWEPVAPRTALSRIDADRLERFHAALEQYRAREWDAAESALRQLAAEEPTRLLYGIYRSRIQAHRAKGVPDAWDGTFRHTSK